MKSTNLEHVCKSAHLFHRQLLRATEDCAQTTEVVKRRLFVIFNACANLAFLAPPALSQARIVIICYFVADNLRTLFCHKCRRNNYYANGTAAVDAFGTVLANRNGRSSVYVYIQLYIYSGHTHPRVVADLDCSNSLCGAGTCRQDRVRGFVCTCDRMHAGIRCEIRE